MLALLCGTMAGMSRGHGSNSRRSYFVYRLYDELEQVVLGSLASATKLYYMIPAEAGSGVNLV